MKCCEKRDKNLVQGQKPEVYCSSRAYPSPDEQQLSLVGPIVHCTTSADRIPLAGCTKGD